MPRTDPQSVAAELHSRIEPADCVIWVGSGLSRGLYPDWRTLVRGLCDACAVAHPDGDGPDALIDKAEECKLANEPAYHDYLMDKFGDGPRRNRDGFLDLAAMQFRGYVTTNFDPSLERAARLMDIGAGPRVHFYPELLRVSLLGENPPPIYHIHGHPDGFRDDESRFVLSRSEFTEAYDPGGGLVSFLTQVLGEPMLFVGCELQEPAIEKMFQQIRRILSKAEDELGTDYTPDRYILLESKTSRVMSDQALDETRSAEELDAAVADADSKEQHENERFRALGIEVLRYDPIDEMHAGLDDVLHQLRLLVKSAPGPGDLSALEASP